MSRLWLCFKVFVVFTLLVITLVILLVAIKIGEERQRVLNELDTELRQ
jgi:hypothetical protein